MTEHHWLADPFSVGSQLEQGTGYSEIWPENVNEMIGNPENSEKRADWSAQDNPNAHPPAFVFTNRKIDDNFKGMGEITVNDGPFFRFVIAMRYPDGVSEEEGEKWFYRERAVKAPCFSCGDETPQKQLEKYNHRFYNLREIFDSR